MSRFMDVADSMLDDEAAYQALELVEELGEPFGRLQDVVDLGGSPTFWIQAKKYRPGDSIRYLNWGTRILSFPLADPKSISSRYVIWNKWDGAVQSETRDALHRVSSATGVSFRPRYSAKNAVDVSPQSLARARTVFEVASLASVSENAEPELADQIERFARDFGEPGISSLSRYMEEHSVHATGAVITLIRAMGRLEDTSTASVRLGLLERLLADESEQVRDAAGLAIVDIGDPAGHRILINAALQEENAELQQMLLDGARELGS